MSVTDSRPDAFAITSGFQFNVVTQLSAQQNSYLYGKELAADLASQFNDNKQLAANQPASVDPKSLYAGLPGNNTVLGA
jgi:hypothetical protein